MSSFLGVGQTEFVTFSHPLFLWVYFSATDFTRLGAGVLTEALNVVLVSLGKGLHLEP